MRPITLVLRRDGCVCIAAMGYECRDQELMEYRHHSMLILITAIMCCVGCATIPPAAPLPAAPTSATAGATTIVAVAAPAPPAITLPKFLGLDVAFTGVRMVGQRIRNRLGSRFPGLESRPPVRSITDPANLGPDASPAVKAAAEAKAEDDQAPQKAKAIRYLASRGCGECYPDTEDALLAAMDDCSEEIRYEAVKGLRSSVGDSCQCCRENSCCSAKMLEKLYELAYEMNESGCYLESSARVRRNARLAICACGGATSEEYVPAPDEGPSGTDAAPTPVEIQVAVPVDETVADATAAIALPPPAEKSVETVASNEPITGAPINPIKVAGLTTETQSKQTSATTITAFELPDFIEQTPESDNDSVRRE
ncbi:hypothetical protein NHH03_01700 [Stieleria sp. TO1_6]|uniref:hypothetical protein n=1 Tax=Stieleria tagensis TaxID=2956795 RepID=UPI00209B6A73|nr:hypothetical protein [Stieleria tagensis]MCO8120434.1 hypothetical protein [Stieleria tagensis]